jgi:pyruvate formate lyase activating enzyme
MNSSDPAGRIHSLETLGASDGPGLRLVIFLQGCPLRCRYCHNPDTWDPDGGQIMAVSELVRRTRRCQPYFGTTGGVTLSGGDPLQQAAFTASLLGALKSAGFSTALDTSGWVSPDLPSAAAFLPEILLQTDLVILDVKSPDPEQFQWLTGRPIQPLRDFLDACDKAGNRLRIRQVILPGWNDKTEDILQLADFLGQWPSLRLEKVQLLPFHTLGELKWQRLGQPFPLAGTPALSQDHLLLLQKLIDKLIIGLFPDTGDTQNQ